MTLGTVSYMSPEQVTGDPLDGRSDLFSFGVVLYECVTGHQPFKGKTSGLILSEILNRVPPPPLVLNPDLPMRLQEIIANCLEKDRELRYQDAAALRTDLKRLKRDLESGPRSTSVTAMPIEARSAAASASTRSTCFDPLVQSRMQARPPRWRRAHRSRRRTVCPHRCSRTALRPRCRQFQRSPPGPAPLRPSANRNLLV
jgi:serine/threonine protein kinase